MIKQIFVFTMILSLGSCNLIDFNFKSEVNGNDEFYLNFDIKEISYQEPNEVDSFQIKSNQDLEVELVFKDLLFNKAYRYPYFYSQEFSKDTVALVGSIRFIKSIESDFPASVFELDFITFENKANLLRLSDSTYRFTSNELLSNKLKNENWGNKNTFGYEDISQVTMTLPFSQGLFPDWQHSPITSNGFYWDHEQLTFSDINYDEEKDEIWVKGNFEVELKELSCGFYQLYHVSNAVFSALLK